MGCCLFFFEFQQQPVYSSKQISFSFLKKLVFKEEKIYIH